MLLLKYFKLIGVKALLRLYGGPTFIFTETIFRLNMKVIVMNYQILFTE